ncbi:sugar transferase [Thermoanaerobacterium thermosaccharolyticum]|uniref:Exopolysaccharide biosynthesis polyprenyl glycosylphosphotransferase n=1 Tax=Thermoanaerobacterium thermosaccharolyticum M0795 TaxID=698948 RepID=L0II75_THETR|nr:sugar transferase [Thermoanaerobacterium thermosaccharolyticum]AGB18543.1 exopolysaccharide biosynthesis polyprenyl glycosylphosphotransferase [Thermoanaerobacterium thermosaccharolyticum M0795]
MWYKKWSIVSDISALIIAFIVALYLRFNFNLSLISRRWYLSTFIILLTLDFLILYFKGLYDNKHMTLFNQITIMIDGMVYSVFIYLFISYFTKMTNFSRLTLIYIFIIGLLLQITFKSILLYLQIKRYKKGLDLTNALILGNYSNELRKIVNKFMSHEYGINVLGYLSDDGANYSDINRLGNIDDFDDVVEKYSIKTIFITSKIDNVDEIINKCLSKYICVYSVNGSINMTNYPMEIEIIDDMPILKLKEVFIGGSEGHVKRLIDFILSFIAIIILSPLFIILALLIKITSPGPVFFVQDRIGLNGKLFKAYKFRTMILNAEEILLKWLEENPDIRDEYLINHKLKDDPRITRVGKFLRKTSLDELPQLFNVLKGDMSLVGPRPYLVRELNDVSSYAKYLWRVPPGITGLWQISGRNDVDFEGRLKMDMQYISNWNIWLDLNILFKTIPAVLKKDGAY